MQDTFRWYRVKNSKKMYRVSAKMLLTVRETCIYLQQAGNYT